MRWNLILILLATVGCANTTKTSVSVYLEKDLWIETDSIADSDAKARLEYKIEQNEPWPFQPR